MPTTIVPQGQYGVDAGNSDAVWRQTSLEAWTLTDAGGVVDTITDGDGYTDILTTATLDTFYLTLPLVDFLGGAIDASSGVFTVNGLSQVLVADNAGDRCLVGTSDNADPTAGGALFDVGGFRYQTGTTADVSMATEASTTASATVTMDRAIYMQLIHRGRADFNGYGFGYQGTGYVVSRAQISLASRAYVPTHLCVLVKNNAAAIQTLRIAAGFHVPQALPTLTITAAT